MARIDVDKLEGIHSDRNSRNTKHILVFSFLPDIIQAEPLSPTWRKRLVFIDFF